MHSEFTKYLIAFLFVSLVGQLAGAQQVPASPAIELSVAGQTDNIYNGEQLAAALRSAYAKGESPLELLIPNNPCL